MSERVRKIILMEGDHVVAESTDPQLWQWVATTIRQDEGDATPALFAGPAVAAAAPDELVKKLAQELILPPKIVIDACAPSLQPPYLHLNFANWQVFHELTGQYARPALTPLALALSLLLLWAEKAPIGPTTVNAGQSVLATVAGASRFPDQDIAACEWLYLIDNQVSFTPGESGKAVVLARAFCLKKKPAL